MSQQEMMCALNAAVIRPHQTRTASLLPPSQPCSALSFILYSSQNVKRSVLIVRQVISHISAIAHHFSVVTPAQIGHKLQW